MPLRVLTCVPAKASAPPVRENRKPADIEPKRLASCPIAKTTSLPKATFEVTPGMALVTANPSRDARCA